MGISLPPGQPPQPQGAKLTEEEQRLVTRLLSDPTYFPVEFRAWIKNFLESSGLTLPASQIIGGGEGTRTGLPAGIILPFPRASLPPDCLFCDGQAIPRSDFTKLFELLGTTWGAGDGVTTFNIPDFRDRTLFCIGGRVSLAQTDGVAFGSRGGSEHHHDFGQTTNSAGDHDHGGGTDGVGDHSHSTDDYQGLNFNLTTGTAGENRSYLEPRGKGMSGAGGHSHNIGTTTDGAHSHFVSGATSGGFLKDKFSFAGVKLAITTGL